jgi:hypothetical protein
MARRIACLLEEQEDKSKQLRAKEVNACVKILLSCFYGSYLWLERFITVDLMLIHWIQQARTRPIGLLPREGYRSRPSTDNKRHLWRCG